jgi:hypothetical protein
MKDDRYVKLYDVSAAANLRTMLMNRNQYVLGKIVIPNMSSCDGAVYVSGDSMYPLLKSGDIIGFKEISDFHHLIYGEMYLVSFCLDGDDYLVVKYVTRFQQRIHTVSAHIHRPVARRHIGNDNLSQHILVAVHQHGTQVGSCRHII